MSRKNYFLLTAFGKDHSGIVAGVAKVLFDLRGNIEDASMTRLGGEFAMMLVTVLPSGVTALKLEKSMQALEKKLRLQISVKLVPPAVAHRTKQEPPKYLLSVYGTDRPGIVHQVSQALSDRKVSVTDLQTKIIGTLQKPIYVMLLEIQVPSTLDLDDLRSALDQLHQDLKVEVSLQDIEAIPL